MSFISLLHGLEMAAGDISFISLIVFRTPRLKLLIPPRCSPAVSSNCRSPRGAQKRLRAGADRIVAIRLASGGYERACSRILTVYFARRRGEGSLKIRHPPAAITKLAPVPQVRRIRAAPRFPRTTRGSLHPKAPSSPAPRPPLPTMQRQSVSFCAAIV